MKKLISLMVAAMMIIPTTYAFADSGDDIEVVETVLTEADTQTSTQAVLTRVSNISPMMESVALDVYYTGEGWQSQEDITDAWEAMYQYLNQYGLYGGEFDFDTDGYYIVPADRMREFFQNMYGEQYDELPVVSRMHSSVIVYDEDSDAYKIMPASGEGIYASLKSVELSFDLSATLTYSIYNVYEDDSELELAQVKIVMESSDVSAYGIKPASTELIAQVAQSED